MAWCPMCGRNMSKGATRCPSCGAYVLAVSTPKDEQTSTAFTNLRQSKACRVASLVVLIVVALVVGSGILERRGDKYLGTWKLTSVTCNGTPMPGALVHQVSIRTTDNALAPLTRIWDFFTPGWRFDPDRNMYRVQTWQNPSVSEFYEEAGDHLVEMGPSKDIIVVERDSLTLTMHRINTTGEPLTLQSKAVRQ